MILKPKLITKLEPGHWASKGLVSSWLFNEGGGDLVYDSSGNYNNGDLQSDALFVGGNFGPAIRLDGVGDHILIPRSTQNEPDHITIILCAKRNSSKEQNLIHKDANGNSRGVQLVDDSGTIIWGVINTAGDSTNVSTATPAVGEWVQYACTYDGTTCEMRINGISIGTSTAISGNLGWSDDDWRIGQHNGGANWDGDVDNVTIYNRALPDSEIRSLRLDPFQMFKRNL